MRCASVSFARVRSAQLVAGVGGVVTDGEGVGKPGAAVAAVAVGATPASLGAEGLHAETMAAIRTIVVPYWIRGRRGIISAASFESRGATRAIRMKVQTTRRTACDGAVRPTDTGRDPTREMRRIDARSSDRMTGPTHDPH
jgi:hypothetical protein